MLAELEIVELLCKGINPCSGEDLNTPRHPEVDAARLKLLDELKRLSRRVTPLVPNTTKSLRGANPSFPNHGKKWNSDDALKLRVSWNAGDTLDSIASKLGRTAGALCAKLALDRIVGDRDAICAENVRRGGEYGKIRLSNQEHD